jgi:anaerobic selenocysteine-containing dehydrogenase
VLAADRGIEDGGWMTISTERAEIEARALVTDGAGDHRRWRRGVGSASNGGEARLFAREQRRKRFARARDRRSRSQRTACRKCYVSNREFRM